MIVEVILWFVLVMFAIIGAVTLIAIVFGVFSEAADKREAKRLDKEYEEHE